MFVLDCVLRADGRVRERIENENGAAAASAESAGKEVRQNYYSA